MGNVVISNTVVDMTRLETRPQQIFKRQIRKRYETFFPYFNRRVLLVVIHAETYEQIFENAAIAIETKADGILLINHTISGEELVAHYNRLQRAYPELWIGLNCLTLSPMELLQKVPDLYSLWTDSCGFGNDGEWLPGYEVLAGFQGLWFGGFAFKHQPQPTDIERDAHLASYFMDVMTTSGEATGKPAEYSKVQRIRQSIGQSTVLALASGVNAVNVKAYLPLVDCFIVASSVTDGNARLIRPKLVELVELVHSYEGD